MIQSIAEKQGDLFSVSQPGKVKEKDSGKEISSFLEIKSLFTENDLIDNRRFNLRTEACLLQLAYAHNKVLSLSNSRTRILAHQVESTYQIVNAFKHRFLIADEVGLGKTIEAGLVIKEFIYRYEYQRILIACPASLLFQWQGEMRNKFNEEFAILDRKMLLRAQKTAGDGNNPWQVHNKVICSLDFLKNPQFQEDLARTKWDAVIFDEAHRLRRDVTSSTLVYSAAEMIAEKTKSLLLLSATPFRGKLEELFYLIALLDKHILGPINSFQEEFCREDADLSRLKEKLAQVVIRRTKREIGGFTERHARTIRFDLYPQEQQLYDLTTEYVAHEFNKAMQEENRAVGFVMTVFQKLLDSSSYALHVALRRRRDRLKSLADSAETHLDALNSAYSAYDLDDLEDQESINDSIDCTLAESQKELQDEVNTLNRLVKLSENIKENKKGERLLELIIRLKKRGIKKFLIFTQFKTTQEYLCDILRGYSVVAFNGSMSADQKEEAIKSFQEKIEICIATEAGGEGRNMQFCNVLINYDLPWSPLKIEQRIGRIHRFGQPHDVYIYNFSTRDTVAERVLEVLTNKLRLFEESIGAPDVMLGQIEDELKLNSLIMNMVSGRSKKREMNNEINSRMEMAKESYKKLSDLTVADHLDFNYDEYYKVTLKERSLSNTRIERFMSVLLCEDTFPGQFLGKKHPRTGLYAIKDSDELVGIKGKYGTFDSEKALERDYLEFLACGHPIVDQCIHYCQEKEFAGYTGVSYVKYGESFSGVVFNFIVTFTTNRMRKELVNLLILSPDSRVCDIQDIELEIMDQNLFSNENSGSAPIEIITSIQKNAEYYFNQAQCEIMKRTEKRKEDLLFDLDLFIDPELEKIQTDYDKRISALEEKRDRQESQMKWYGKDMRSAITRTQNQILKFRQLKEKEMSQCKNYAGIEVSIELLNCSAVVSYK